LTFFNYVFVNIIFGQIIKHVDPIGVKLDRWWEAGMRMIPNLLVAILLLVAFRYIASYCGRLTSRLLGKASQNVGMVSLISAVTRIAIFMVGVFFALGVLGLDKTVTSLVAGAGVLALALGFAFQDLTTNFISGAFIVMQRPIEVGDVIETNGFMGKVKSIGLRSVKLDNFAGQVVEIPSKDIFQKPIVNFTHSGERRVQLLSHVSYQDNLEVVETLALKTIEAFSFLNKDKPVEFSFTRFTENSVEFQILFWIDQKKTSSGKSKSEAMKALKRAFDEEGIVMPVTIKGIEQIKPDGSAPVALPTGG
jgi:small conductance mechanosensitive channel